MLRGRFVARVKSVTTPLQTLLGQTKLRFDRKASKALIPLD
jgi:hypothetical protein